MTGIVNWYPFSDFKDSYLPLVNQLLVVTCNQFFNKLKLVYREINQGRSNCILISCKAVLFSDSVM